MSLPAPAPTVELLDLGRRPYAEVWEFQKRLVDERARGDRGDTLVLVEHEPVYTGGTGARGPAPAGLPHPFYAVERGGLITYHGPGQLVGYPILKLDERGLLVGTYLRELERTLIAALGEFAVAAKRESGRTGVWVGAQGGGARKIAAIGVAVRGWISYHGFALNCGGDLSGFGAIRPCGFSPESVTSVSRESGREVSVAELKPALLAAFRKTF